ncbi:hypothetical protein GCM10010256_07730 [Streptomyces coeruleorubidus]|nr:hypothetical protein GCM10010256_07730 [Streptomyces coeruleorubidus]
MPLAARVGCSGPEAVACEGVDGPSARVRRAGLSPARVGASVCEGDVGRPGVRSFSGDRVGVSGVSST